MRTIPEPYRLADQAIKKINRAALRRAEKAKDRLTVLGFDELNVMQQVDALYSGLERDAKKIYRQLFIDRYTEILLFLKGKNTLTAKEEDAIEELAEMYIAGLLTEPNKDTHYVFESETIRKRDRAKEAMLSTRFKIQKQIALDKAVRYWTQQAGFYADFVSQDAEIQAMKDTGVKRVQRHERNDNKVCATCKLADGEIYDIDKIPQSHLRCRRWFTPV